MKIRERLKAMSAELKALFSHSIYEAAEFNGLAIEYPQDMPTAYTGHLDSHDMPRFIAVNPNLPQSEQVYVIAREIGRYAQLRGGSSMFIDRTWKRNLLAAAPAETRDFINSLDVEVRASWIMLWHADKVSYSEYLNRHPKSHWLSSFPAAVSDFLFWKLRIGNYLSRIRSIFMFMKNKLAV